MIENLAVSVPDNFAHITPVRTPSIFRNEEILRPTSNNYSTA